MNDTIHAYWERYIRDLASLMGLAHWDVHLARDRPVEGALCDVFVPEWQDRASIRIHPCLFSDYTPAQQRDNLVHELVHLYTRPMKQTARLAFSDEDEPVWFRYFQREYELATDRIAKAWADSANLPLPVAAPPVTPTDG